MAATSWRCDKAERLTCCGQAGGVKHGEWIANMARVNPQSMPNSPYEGACSTPVPATRRDWHLRHTVFQTFLRFAFDGYFTTLVALTLQGALLLSSAFLRIIFHPSSQPLDTPTIG
ncbi:hypothetical protein BO82DRAFT_401609 [Aspergillus uvarum CBS 121591]|uniref:Uncharacterized protein n=1 Tax=Aspergillus uvarum CBS 121591 TaxID=1448315 RepID=A0A319CA03_9EURO|nr:hypothetical protein BO82DRAFT_401609 [Aspergillus uvarum CBS 121591]PYH82285.1 hypothetical protein BO82DRAFT_401609 [Aspergillus uvarum CBS 121591]